MKDLLALRALTRDDVIEVLELGREVKSNPVYFSHALEGKTLVMLFQKTSTRTRVSFEVAMTQLGGHAVFLDYVTTNFSIASMKDEIRCVSRYADVIMARVYGHETLEEIAEVSDVPVINGLSDTSHPCQILGDLLTIGERFPEWSGVEVAWVGDGNNVCNSLVVACALLGIRLRVATPPEYRPPEYIREFARNTPGSRVTFYGDAQLAVKGAHVVYTDTWVSLGQEGEAEARQEAFRPYQVNLELLEGARPGYIFMHCLPAHRGFEVTDDVIDSPNSVVFDQAENRLHIQKAILLWLLREDQ
ncbi:MAG: ornithine carbamoyltransferase [Promethearchaeota archaeon]